MTEQTLSPVWRSAYRMRCCPPAEILHGDMTPELEAHLAICPDCRQRRHQEVKTSFPSFALPEEPARTIQPGELRAVSRCLSGWGPKNRYYHAPVVLVLENTGDETVSVVQVSGETDLYGPGDIDLGGDLIGFAQPWNRYILKKDDLTTLLGRVSSERLEQIKHQAEPDNDDREYPAPHSGSLLWFFRQMEVETGWYFCHRSMAELLGTLSDPFFPVLPDPETLRDQLLTLSLRVPNDENISSYDDLLAMTVPDDDLLPLAADTSHPGSIRVLLLEYDGTTINKAEIIQGTVLSSVMDDDGLRISGILDREISPTPHVVFRLVTNDHLVAPLPGRQGIDGSLFWVIFPNNTVLRRAEELIIRIISAVS